MGFGAGGGAGCDGAGEAVAGRADVAVAGSGVIPPTAARR
ncbi:hypothetical protein FRAHR75_360006 [Frankia sp. Hr75.2]|nr:hypothetical protein FRAHR75_360006 [Frankia sp. Hr75.2]